MEPKCISSAPAMTVVDAAKLNSSSLKLVHHKLMAIPAGLKELRALTSLDLSDNPISDVSPKLLPTGLQCLWVIGCALERLPVGLPSLEQLFASANRISSIEGLFSCSRLLHAGLSYNQISTLTSSSSSSSSSSSLSHCPLMSLDLAHNDISNLGAALGVLSSLPQLRNLSLRGNPVCLRPNYIQAVMEALPLLVILDGQRLDGTPTASTTSTTNPTAATIKPPDSARPTPARRPRSAEGTASKFTLLQLAEPIADTPLLLEMSNLQLFDKPEAVFGRIRAAAAAEVAAAAEKAVSPAAAAAAADAVAAAADGVDTEGNAAAQAHSKAGSLDGVAPKAAATAAVAAVDVVVPLRPIVYHVEWEDMQGTCYASTCTTVQPPAPITEDDAASAASKSPEPGKKGSTPVAKGARGSAAADAKGRAPSAKSKGKPAGGKGGKGGLAEGDGAAVLQPQVRLGYCRAVLKLQADVVCRDWLRAGATVDLYRTHFDMFPLAPAAASASDITASAAAAPAAAAVPAPKAAAGKGGKGAAAVPAAAAMPDPAALWRYEARRELLGSCRLTAAAALLEGATYVADGTMEFMPPPALFDKAGIRMALEGAGQAKHALGSMGYSLQLHYQGDDGKDSSSLAALAADAGAS